MARQYVDGIADIVLERLSILEVVNSYLPLKRTGRNYKALCPFHNEKTPSFVVSDEKQIFHCFGCGESGSAISFVMKIENLDFIDAIEHIAERYNIDLNPYRAQHYDEESKKEHDTLYVLNKTVAKGFYNELKKTKEPFDYLVNRSIKPETLIKFGVGFAPEQWDFIRKNLKSRYDDKILLKSGLIIQRENKTGYYDRFRNRIIFPIFDIRGRVIGFGGRVMDDSQPKYLNSPDTPVFNKSYHLYGMNFAKNSLGDQRQIIIVEGYMDVISLFDKGIKNVAASLGTALTDGHGKLIERYAKEAVLLYDSDAAGIKATRRAIEVLNPLKVKVKVLSLPDGYDPDEFVLKFGKDKLLELINHAKDAIEYMLDFYKEDLNFLIKSDVVEYVNRVKDIFKTISNPVEFELYLNRVSEETEIQQDILLKLLKKKPVSQENEAKPLVYKVTSKEMKLFQRLFDIFIHERQYFQMIKDEFGFEEIKHPLYNSLCAFIDSNTEFNLDNAIDQLPLEGIELLEKSLNNKDYISVKGEMREVRKIYYDLLFNDQQRILLKIKEERDLLLSNIEKGTVEYKDAEKRFSDKYFAINSKLAEINKSRG